MGLPMIASKPKLSVGVTSFNAADTIQTCLTSLCQQASASPFETLLADSSTDGTAELVRDKHPALAIDNVLVLSC